MLRVRFAVLVIVSVTITWSPRENDDVFTDSLILMAFATKALSAFSWAAAGEMYQQERTNKQTIIHDFTTVLFLQKIERFLPERIGPYLGSGVHT